MTTETYETVVHTVTDGIHELRLNRPETLNAINEQLIKDATAVMAEVSVDPNARVLVVTGGPRAFCAGADVGMMDTTLDRESAGETTWGSDEIRQKLRLRFQRLTQTLYRVPVPTIALVRGPAVGGGLDLSCACDLVLVVFDHGALHGRLHAARSVPRPRRLLAAAAGGRLPHRRRPGVHRPVRRGRGGAGHRAGHPPGRRRFLRGGPPGLSPRRSPLGRRSRCGSASSSCNALPRWSWRRPSRWARWAPRSPRPPTTSARR